MVQVWLSDFECDHSSLFLLRVQQQLLVELLECEREYVGALTQPLSLSQEPGGQAWTAELRWLGSALRATRDRLLAFHSSCLLSELEGCMSHPSRAGSCFLRHVSASFPQLLLHLLHAGIHFLCQNSTPFFPSFLTHPLAKLP